MADKKTIVRTDHNYNFKEFVIQMDRGLKPGQTCPSGAPLGELAGKYGVAEGRSPKYNSSYLVRIDGEVYDIHDQNFRAITFKTELTDLLNKYSKENDSDTPDRVLAGYILGCLDVFNKAVRKRDAVAELYSDMKTPDEEAYEVALDDK